MFTLILYDKETNKIVDFIPGINNVEVDGTTVSWSQGEISGIESGFIVVNGSPKLEIGGDVTPFLNQDRKNNLPNRRRMVDQSLEKLQAKINFLFSELTQEQINRAVAQGVITQEEASRLRRPTSPQARMQI